MVTVSSQVGLRYASFETRLVAFVLDLIVLFSFFMLFVAVAFLQLLLRSDFGEVDPPGSAVFTAVALVLADLLFVPAYFLGLWAWRGQTVGKMAMAIKVVRRDGSRVGLGTEALRLIGYLFSTLLLFGGFLMIAFDRQRRGLHDRLADTVVVEPA